MKADFKKPRSLTEALQRFTLELECLMQWLRDEAQHHDNFDQTVLDAAQTFLHLLEDTQSEADVLIATLERRVSGAV